MFSFQLNLADYNLKPGDRLEYVVVVTDNDEINGFKSTVSGKNFFAVPELDQLENQLAEKEEQLKSELAEASKDAKELREEMKKIKSDMVNKSQVDWKDKQRLQNMIDMHKDLEQRLEQMKKQMDQNNEEKENLLENSEELLEKQKQQKQKGMPLMKNNNHNK